MLPPRYPPPPPPPPCSISDASMGGAYLTLLNTVANLGVIVPKIFVFAGEGGKIVMEL